MKVFAILNNYKPVEDSKSLGWYLIADSAVTNVGKPFYLPEYVGPTEVILTMVVKISRLGKFIDQKFASRYYSEYAPGLHFRLPEYGNILRDSGLPADASHSFDRSLIVGDFRPIQEFEPLFVKNNGEIMAELNMESFQHSIDQVISRVSLMNTIKIGDFVLPGLITGGFINVGDFLEVGNKREQCFHVRVK